MNDSIQDYIKPLQTKLKDIENALLLPFYKIDLFIQENEETMTKKKLERLVQKRMKLAEILSIYYDLKERMETELGKKGIKRFKAT